MHHSRTLTLAWPHVLVLPLANPKRDPSHGMRWYAAAAKWEKILRSEEVEYRFQLRPGTTVIFDNHRVLHGRSAFTGLRRICGGYSEFLSTCQPADGPLRGYLQPLPQD